MSRSYPYQFYEMAHAALAPARVVSDATHFLFSNPWNPLSKTLFGKNMSASAEMFERLTRRYGKPSFGLDDIHVNGRVYPILEEIVWTKPFCNLLHFARPDFREGAGQPKLLIVAPMSGHYATLLRGTVEAFLPHFDVYITDWVDARMVPLALGTFDLDDYIDYLREILVHLGPGVHTIGVCQPSVPLLAAAALMEADGDQAAPASMTLMGGPVDTRKSPTEVNKLAEQRGVEWFRRNCLHTVPFPYPGLGREVYPGFLQLSGFMAMNIDRHVTAHLEMFQHLVAGDEDPTEKHREFYDEYLAVMDLAAEYYMQTVETVFVRHALPKGEMTHRGQAGRPESDPQQRASERGRREGRHLGRRPNPRRQRFVRQHPRITEALSSGQGCGPLRCVQRLPLPQRDRPDHPRVHRRDRGQRQIGQAAEAQRIATPETRLAQKSALGAGS